MAHVYIDSNATGSPATGADWANAYLTLDSAVDASNHGDSFWIASDHNETSSTDKIIGNLKGTSASPSTYISVNKAGSTPPVLADVLAGAVIEVSGGSSPDIQLNFEQYQAVVFYGITFRTEASANSSYISLASNNTPAYAKFVNCTFAKRGTSGINFAIRGAHEAQHRIHCVNCAFVFGSTADKLGFNGADILIEGGTIAATGSVPTTLFHSNSGNGAFYRLRLLDVDLSNISGALVENDGMGGGGYLIVERCKLHASVTPGTLSNAYSQRGVLLLQSDDGSQVARHEKHTYAGNQVIDTAVVRTGGASDGTTPISWKITTNANTEQLVPYECLPIYFWNEATSQISVTVFGSWSGSILPKNNEVWMSVEYLDSASFTTKAVAYNGFEPDELNLATAISQTADGTSVWGAESSPARVNFKMSVTFTPAQKGSVKINVFAGVASETIYIDPKVEATS